MTGHIGDLGGAITFRISQVCRWVEDSSDRVSIEYPVMLWSTRGPTVTGTRVGQREKARDKGRGRCASERNRGKNILLGIIDTGDGMVNGKRCDKKARWSGRR